MSEKRYVDRRLDLKDRRLSERRRREQVGKQLRDYYHSCLSKELPPRLLAVLKKLDE
jgi:hypothetical protein